MPENMVRWKHMGQVADPGLSPARNQLPNITHFANSVEYVTKATLRKSAYSLGPICGDATLEGPSSRHIRHGPSGGRTLTSVPKSRLRGPSPDASRNSAAGGATASCGNVAPSRTQARRIAIALGAGRLKQSKVPVALGAAGAHSSYTAAGKNARGGTAMVGGRTLAGPSKPVSSSTTWSGAEPRGEAMPQHKSMSLISFSSKSSLSDIRLEGLEWLEGAEDSLSSSNMQGESAPAS